eukprot:CAMPEP_0184666806 /NCGR_PEP_ID=MMETSP0308-20130426/63899_1 /TAXON_ID=38269 /ORGANISM="Gloeochaete witrockiana, Strain SAG 46.84" /LENGTH=205 /DNA_ID=CAMNT_0027111601 /DNA_START=315 /DNA_END=929 /DNA_ORIENTATION=+
MACDPVLADGDRPGTDTGLTEKDTNRPPRRRRPPAHRSKSREKSGEKSGEMPIDREGVIIQVEEGAVGVSHVQESRRERRARDRSQNRGDSNNSLKGPRIDQEALGDMQVEDTVSYIEKGPPHAPIRPPRRERRANQKKEKALEHESEHGNENEKIKPVGMEEAEGSANMQIDEVGEWMARLTVRGVAEKVPPKLSFGRRGGRLG